MSASSSSDSSTSAQAAPTSPCSSACSRNTSSTKWGDRVILGSVTNCIVIACLVIVGLFLCKYYTTSTDNEKTPRVCHTEACIEAGKSLYESINFTVKPCDDFYEYACGNWIAKNPIPDDDTAVSSFKIVQNSMSQILRRLLEQNASQVKNPPETVKVALDLYRECMDEKSREKVGIEPLVENLFKMIGKHWPVMRAKKQWFGDQLYSASIETFVKFWGHVSVISWFIHVDEKNATQKMLHFIPPRFGIGRIEYSEPKEYESLITAYKKYMRDVATLFIDEVHPARNDESAFTDRIEEIFKFESRLALASSPPEEMRDSSVWYNKMTLGDFKHLTGYFNWIEFLNAYTRPLNLTNKFTYETQVIVMDKGYYSKLGRILAETPIHVLQNYMGFMYIASMSRYTNQQLINATFEFHKEETGAKELEPLWERCVAHVDIRLPYAVSRLYVDQHTEPGTKEQTEELIADLKATFRKLVQSEVPWLDETTRKRALDKVDNMVTFVAYPEWIHNNTVVDEDAGFTDTYWAKVKKGRYLEAIIRLQRIEAIKAWKDLAKPRNLTLDWMMPPTEVNAAYGATHNGLLLPAAILHPPFFNPDRPAYLNYAAIGSIIGHEITHGFDDAGHEFDKTGSLVNWWTNETMEQFKNTSQCFIDQYGAIVDNTTGKNLNGEHTLGENIADNGGIREAYFAFQLRKANKTLAMEVVPQMEKFTIEQLFFLSYAKVWCANVRVESLRMDIDYDPHAPKRYRVNIPLSNFEEFSNAFKCPTGSTMNPSKKCILW